MDDFAMLRSRLLSRAEDLTVNELGDLLSYWGYRREPQERASVVHVAFFHPAFQHVIRLSGSHAGGCLKAYQLDQVVEELTERGLLP